MSTIFISYSTKDRATADIVYKQLIEMGYEKPFRDDHPDSGIPAGSDWEQELYRKLRLCKALIVLCSKNWLDSKWCFAELAYAKAMGKEFFPIRIDDSNDVPSIVAERQAINFSDQNCWQRLQNGLEDAKLAPHDDFFWDISECPYPGLEPFTENHAGVYFGRDTEIQELRETLNRMRSVGQPRLLYVVGASGSGKSSLVRAGLLPRLKTKETGQWCLFRTFRWNDLRVSGRTWAEQLAVDLADAWPQDDPKKPEWIALRERYTFSSANSASTAADRFIDDTKNLLVTLKRSNSTPLFILDQFEEVLVSTDGEPTGPFLQFLGCVMSSPRSPWRCVATVRSDFLNTIQTRPELIAWKQHTELYSLPLMNPERFYDVIRRPADKVGITFEPETLVDQIVKDTGDNDALPLLAFTLRELYEQYGADKQFTYDEYANKLGRLEGCLKQVADELLTAQLESTDSKDTQRALQLAFSSHLVGINEQDKFVRRTAVWSEIKPAAQPVLSMFIARRLLTSRVRDEKNPRSEHVVEVAHEALFRKWDRLKDWLDVRRDLLRWRRDVGRDRLGDGEKWTGLTRSQLAIAHDWPKLRSEELFPQEIAWIKSAKLKIGFFWMGIAAVAVTILGVAATAWYFQVEAAHQGERRALEETKRGDAEKVAKKRTADSIMSQVVALGDTDSEQEIPKLLVSAREIYSSQGTPTFLPDLAELLHSRDIPALLTRWIIPGDSVSQVEFNPATGVFLCCSVLEVDQASPARVALTAWPIAGETPLWRVERNRDLKNLTVSADGRWCLATDGRTGCVFDAATGAIHHELVGHAEEITSCDFTPDSQFVLTASEDDTVRVWNVSTGQFVRSFAGHLFANVQFVKALADGKRVLSSTNKDAVLWELGTTKVVKSFPASKGSYWKRFALSPDGSAFFAADTTDMGGSSYTLFRTDLESGLSSSSSGKEFISHLDICDEGDLLVAVTGAGKPSLVLEERNGHRVASFEIQRPSNEWADGFVRDFRVSSDGNFALIAVQRRVELWRLPRSPDVAEFSGFQSQITPYGSGISFGGMLTSPSGTQSMTYFDEEKLRLQAKVLTASSYFRSGHIDPIEAVAVSPVGRLALSVSGGEAKLWDLATAMELKTLRDPNGPITSIGFAANGQAIISDVTSRDGKKSRILCRDLATMRELWSIARETESTEVGSPSSSFEMWYSSSGKLIATTSNAPSQPTGIMVVNTETGQSLSTFAVDAPKCVAISMDDKLLAVGYEAGIGIYNLNSGTKLTDIPTTDIPHRLALSRSAKLLAGLTSSGIGIWDVETRERRHDIRLPGAATSLAFGPGDSYLVTGSADTTQVWDVETGQQVFQFGDPSSHLAATEDGAQLVMGGGAGLAHGRRLALYDLSRSKFKTTPRLEGDVAVDSGAGFAATLAHYGAWRWSAAEYLYLRAGGHVVSPLNVARACWRGGMFDEARELLRASRDKGEISEFHHALFAQGVSLAEADRHVTNGIRSTNVGQFESAVTSFEMAAELTPESVRCHFLLGQALMMHEKYSAAIAAFSRAIALDPYVSDLYFFRAKCLDRGTAEDRAKADEDYKIVGSTDSRIGVALDRDAAGASEMGDHALAISLYDLQLRIYPGSSAIHLDRCFANAHLGNFEAAFADFANSGKAKTFDFDKVRLLVLRGSSRPDTPEGNTARETDYKEAFSEVEVALLYSGFHDDWRVRLANRDFDKVRTTPWFRAMYQVLKSVENRKSDQYEAALADLDSAVKLLPDSAAVLFTRGTVLERLNRVDDATRDYEEVVKLQPDHSFARFNLACKFSMKAEAADKSDNRTALAYVDLSLSHLRLALTSDRSPSVSPKHAQDDSELKFVREDPRFKTRFEAVLNEKE